MIKIRERISRFFVRQDAECERDGRHAAWIERMAEGDLDALSAFYDETSQVIFGFVCEILDGREAAENALVEIYETARREAGSFNPRRTAPIDWLITLARNVAVTRRRRMISSPTPDQFKHKRQAARAAVTRLPVEQRTILEMTYVRGLTADEVARVLELPIDYVKEQIVSGMLSLRTGSQNTNGITIRLSTLRSL